MAFLARLYLRNLQHRVIPSSASASASSLLPYQRFATSTTSNDKELKSDISDSREVAVDKGETGRKKSRLLPKSLRGLLRRNRDRDVAPFDLQYLFPSGLGHALLQASENFNRVLEQLTPSRLIGRAKEHDDCYKLKYRVPGLSKEDIKITVADGVLTIKGEHKEEDEGSDDDEHWSYYGHFDTSVLLPDDAKEDEIKAEMKDGVLRVIIPRTERPKKDAKEVQIQ